MNQSNLQIVDLPNEILILILRNLTNIEVLYSLLDIHNQRLDIIAQHPTFTNVLKFVLNSSSTQGISTISESILDRFCTDVLPRIHANVQSLLVDHSCLDRILHAARYPNLTELQLVNLNHRNSFEDLLSKTLQFLDLFSKNRKQNPSFLLDGLHMLREHLRDLVLGWDDFNHIMNIELTVERLFVHGFRCMRSREFCVKNICAIISTFEKLEHLSFLSSTLYDISPLSLKIPEDLTFSSSTLTTLCVNVEDFTDCRILLNGSLKALTTFIVRLDSIRERRSSRSSSFKANVLPGLKCFSLTCFLATNCYYELVPPLIRRMSNLEELTFYVTICNRSHVIPFVSGDHLDTEILRSLSKLRTFTFNFVTSTSTNDPSLIVSKSDIERTFTKLPNQKICCLINRNYIRGLTYHTFTLPFQFDRLDKIGHDLPNMIFDSVLYVAMRSGEVFGHEFFVRFARVFPFLKRLSLCLSKPPSYVRYNFVGIDKTFHLDNIWDSIVEYPHLVTLDFGFHTHSYYIGHFLDEEATHLPRLMEFKVEYANLQLVTTNFSRKAMRRNCANVKRLVTSLGEDAVHSKDVHDFFPSL